MEYIEKNINLYKLRTGIALSTRAAANFTRYVLLALLIRAYTLLRAQLAKFLRESPYNVNLLIAGYEEMTGPSLYFMDYLASIHEIPRAAHGYAAHFTLGLLDRYYKKDLTEEEGMKIIYMCIEELKTRFLVNRTGFTIKVVNKVCTSINLSPPCFRVGRC
jgi:20S proteasome subunit beta 4